MLDDSLLWLVKVGSSFKPHWAQNKKLVWTENEQEVHFLLMFFALPRLPAPKSQTVVVQISSW